MAAFEQIVLPIGMEYNPELIIVSAGFDAAIGHAGDLGGYRITAEGFAYMTAALKGLGQRRLVLLLEGGYVPDVIARMTEACVRVLLGHPLPPLITSHSQMDPQCFLEKFSSKRLLVPSAAKLLQQVVEIQSQFWNLRKIPICMALQQTMPLPVVKFIPKVLKRQKGSL